MVRHVERNDNVNLQLTSNCTYLVKIDNQIRELLKDRKVLLRAKHEMLVMKNKERVNSIAYARDQDLRVLVSLYRMKPSCLMIHRLQI